MAYVLAVFCVAEIASAPIHAYSTALTDMADRREHDQAYHAFCLAEHLVLFTWYAQENWFGAEPQEALHPVIGLQAQHAVHHLRQLRKPTSGWADRLQSAICQAQTSYTHAWQGPLHQKQIQLFEQSESEGIADLRRRLIRQSSLVKESWQAVRRLALSCSRKLAIESRAGFLLAVRLVSVNCSTWLWDRRRWSTASYSASTDLGRRLEHLTRILEQHYNAAPFVEGQQVWEDLTYAVKSGVTGHIETIRQCLSRGRRPNWSSSTRELRFGNRLIKRFKRVAKTQFLILESFQELHWSHEIDDPIPSIPNETDAHRKRRLNDCIKELNDRHGCKAIRFRVGATGKSIRWDLDDRP